MIVNEIAKFEKELQARSRDCSYPSSASLFSSWALSSDEYDISLSLMGETQWTRRVCAEPLATPVTSLRAHVLHVNPVPGEMAGQSVAALAGSLESDLVAGDLEAGPAHFVDRLLQAFVGERLDLAALVADDVVVVLAGGVDLLVAEGIAAEVDPVDQPQLLQLLDRPVDRRPAYLRQPLVDLEGGQRAAQFAEHVDDRLAGVSGVLVPGGFGHRGIEGKVLAALGSIDYWFVTDGRRVHKTVHHYLLRSTGGELSDADYEVAEVAWVPLVELPKRLTYSDERRLARMAEGVIAELTADPGRLAQSEADSNRTEPNDYEKAAAARNQRRKDPTPPPPPRRRRRRGRRPAPPGD
mgnify:CR=1 FL=1